ncbi:MAG: NRDE family protein, partial [Planctomycetes bacterium]|nr:NRDE family protein [Planctomycetota bacterium]
MCSLIVLRGLDADYPLVVAANRDERLDRKASPPGAFVGQRRRMLSPRDRVAGGTWLALDDRGRVAAVTNLFGEPPVPDAPSRGHLPHLVLDHDDLEAGLEAVRAHLAEHAHSGFQLVVADRHRVRVLRHARGALREVEWRDAVLTISNEHAAGELVLRGMAPALQPG